MSMAFICPNRDLTEWVAALKEQDSTLHIEVWPEIAMPEQVEFAICWNHPPGVLQQFPNLKCISSLGAGVEQLLNDTTRPPGIPLVRIVDADLKQSMAEYVMLAALSHFRRFTEYRRQQKSGEWTALAVPHISTVDVGIMGCGELGRYVAERLADFGFSVCCWSRSRKELDSIKSYSGNDELDAFLGRATVLVCMLALTPETENILDERILKRLPQGAYLINVARGAHLVEADLLSALDCGHLSGALLDVSRKEPLPTQHPFWTHKNITITPHIASITNPKTAVGQLVENYRRVLAHEPLMHQVPE